jgi:hypothetical protein
LSQVGGVLLAMTALLGPTAAQAGNAVNHWGYAVGRQPATASYQPGPGNARDDQNSTVTIDRMGIGLYLVTYPHVQPIAGNDGVFLATAISSNGATCGPRDQNDQATQVQTLVRCMTRAGTPTNEKFSTNFLLLQSTVGKAAYVLADQPVNANYTPDSTYQFNSTGASNTIERSGVGWYDVSLPGLETSTGHAEVSAAFAGGYCEVVAMTAFPTVAESIRVYCRDATGAKADGLFTLIFTDGQGLKKPGSTGVAYLLADQPAALGYVPAATTRFQSNGGIPHVHRNSAGHYNVQLGGMSAGGAAEVTTYGSSSNRCEISSLPMTGSPVTIGVVCVKPDGTPADTKFGLEYTH